MFTSDSKVAAGGYLQIGNEPFGAKMDLTCFVSAIGNVRVYLIKCLQCIVQYDAL